MRSNELVVKYSGFIPPPRSQKTIAAVNSLRMHELSFFFIQSNHKDTYRDKMYTIPGMVVPRLLIMKISTSEGKDIRASHIQIYPVLSH